MYLKTFAYVIKQIWPMLFIFAVVLTLIKITDTIVNKKKLNLFRNIINLLFLMYILILFHVVTFYDVDWSTYNLVFFREILRYEFGSEMFFRNIMGNIVMFIPYGIYMTYYFNLKRPFLLIGLAIILSSAIEFTQYFIGRVFDVDDILLNVAGAFLGFLIYRICYFFYKRRRHG